MWYFLLIILGIWRIFLLSLSYFGSIIIPIFGDRFPYWRELLASSNLPPWIWSFGNFDGVHYITIAKSGYSAQFTQAFFPLYPILMHFFSFGNYLSGGILISNLFLLLAVYLFSKLLLIDYGSHDVKWILLFFLFYPFSFFFGSVYNESLFLVFVFSSFYFARKHNWLGAGIMGALASATRLVGVFLLPALIWEWCVQIKNQKLKIKNTSKNSKIFSFIPLLIIPVGLLIYMIFLQFKFGDWLYFIHAQPYFGASRTAGEIILLPQVIIRYFKMFVTVSPKNYDFWVAVWEFLSLVISSGLLVISYFRKVRLSYIIFSIFAIFTPTLTGTLSSLPRYTLVAFPIFISLGMIKSEWLKGIFIVISILLLFLFTMLFTRGYWVS